MEKKIIILLSILFSLSLILLISADWTPQENINLRDLYNISNVPSYLGENMNITGIYYGNGSQLTGVSGEETLWNANYTTFLTHIGWSVATNGTLMFASNWNATNTSYYLETNPFSFYNSTDFDYNDYLLSTDWNSTNISYYLVTNPFNFWNSTFATFNKTYADTLYSTISEPLWGANYSGYLTVAGWNDSGLIKDWDPNSYIKDWNSSGHIKDWSYVNTWDTTWVANWSAYNTTWGTDTNTWDTSWLANWTAYNSSWSSGADTNETTRFNALVGWDCGGTDKVTGVLANGTIVCETDVGAGAETDPKWGANYTVYNDTWTSTDSEIWLIASNGTFLEEETTWLANYSDFLTVSSWNDTGLIQDWNATSLIIDWNASGHIKDWSGAASDATWVTNYTLYNNTGWTTTSTEIWNVVYNSTFALISEPKWSVNYTAYNASWSLDTTDWTTIWTQIYNETEIDALLDIKVGWTTLWTQVYNETEVVAINTSMKTYVDNEFVSTEADPLFVAWDNITGIPTATPSDGDTTHLSLADEIYDWIIGLSYLADLHDDTSPQLGGYLDADGENIGSTADEIENIYIGDTTRIYFGDGQDASMYYNGTTLIISG